MYTTPIPSRYWEQELRDNLGIDFHPTPSDSGHVIVSRYLPDEGKQTIGHVYVEIEGDETRFICCNRKGRQIFPPTTDFNLVATRYERYARDLARHEKAKQNQKQILGRTNINLKNPNPMKTKTKNQRVNQFRFIKYEKSTPEGHRVTIVDSYNNVHARVHEIFNDETKQKEFVVFDHEGKIMTKSNRMWEVEKFFVDNREQLLEAAHQRRIESKQQSKTVAPEKPQEKQTSKTQERKNEIENLRGEKSSRGKQVETPSDRNEERTESRASAAGSNSNADEENNQQQEREDELADLRDSQDDDRGDMDMER